jgi:hypothetical protein
MSVNKLNNSGQERDEARKHSKEENRKTPSICTYLLASNEVNNLTAGHRT